MSANLHPIFADLLRTHGAPAPMTAAELVKHGEALASAKAAEFNEANDARALALQIKSNPQHWL